MSKLDKETSEILAQCYADSRKTAKVFFSNRFHRPFTHIHDDVFNLIDKKPSSPTYKPKKLIVLPRGMGKTSIANMLLPAKKTLFQEERYIVPVSATSTLAKQSSENLKKKLLQNKKIEAIFGDIKTGTLNKEQWVVKIGGSSDDEEDFNICIMPRGSGQQIRGLLYDDYRPGLIIIDDLEDPEDLLTSEQRNKQKKWFWADLMQSVDNYAPLGSWEIIYVGTVVHEDALIVDLMQNDDWDKVVHSLCDEDLKSNIPEWISDQEVKNKYNELKRVGQTTTFYREFMNKATAGEEDKDFPREVFKDYDPSKVDLDSDPDIESLILVDLARTTSETSTDSAIIGVSIDLRTQGIYVRDIIHGKLHPDEVYDEMFNMGARINARVIGVETTGLHEHAVYPIKNEMARRKVNIELIELKARGGQTERGKVKRILSLKPFYRQGLIYHNPSCCAVLESQLSDFPYSKLWDVMDAFGYVTQILEEGQRYMSPLGDDQVEDQQTVEEEFDELDYIRQEIPLEEFRAF